MAVEGGGDYRQRLVQRQLQIKKRKQAGLSNTRADAGPPSSKTFSSPPKSGKASLNKFATQGVSSRDDKIITYGGKAMAFAAPNIPAIIRGITDPIGTAKGVAEVSSYTNPATLIQRGVNAYRGEGFTKPLMGADAQDIEQAVEIAGIIPYGKVAKAIPVLTKYAPKTATGLKYAGSEALAQSRRLGVTSGFGIDDFGEIGESFMRAFDEPDQYIPDLPEKAYQDILSSNIADPVIVTAKEGFVELPEYMAQGYRHRAVTGDDMAEEYAFNAMESVRLEPSAGDVSRFKFVPITHDEALVSSIKRGKTYATASIELDPNTGLWAVKGDPVNKALSTVMAHVKNTLPEDQVKLFEDAIKASRKNVEENAEQMLDYLDDNRVYIYKQSIKNPEKFVPYGEHLDHIISKDTIAKDIISAIDSGEIERALRLTEFMNSADNFSELAGDINVTKGAELVPSPEELADFLDQKKWGAARGTALRVRDTYNQRYRKAYEKYQNILKIKNAN